MHKLNHSKHNEYYINSTRVFVEGNMFKEATIQKVFDFAYDMAFGNGEHRDHRTGGEMSRKKGQIFMNTFQGKLSELGVYNIFFTKPEVYQKLSQPDFYISGLGQWDESDIKLDDIKFSIKSTKYYGNLLLLETKDWNEEGEYIPNIQRDKNAKYDYFVLVRIKPDGEKLMRSHKLLYANSINKEELYQIVKADKWEYDIVGYITYSDLQSIIKNNFVLPQHSLLNGKIPMDAENYYIQGGDMKDFKSLIESL